MKKSIFIKFTLGLLLLTFTACDKDEFKEKETEFCTEKVNIPTSITPFLEDFESYESFALPSPNWAVVNEEGVKGFIVKTYQANNYIAMSSFNSNSTNKTWLISPKMDFDTMIDKNMSFKLADAMNNGNPLKLMYSTNYDGYCPSKNTWSEIATTQIQSLINNEGNADYQFESSGDIDISSLTGNGVLAFVYEGSESGIVSQILLDDIIIGQSLAFVPSLNITGTIEVSEVLTAHYSPLIDASGNSINVAYQWYRANDENGTNETIITGVNSATYSLTNEDSGKYVTVKTVVNGVETTTDYVGLITGTITPPIAVVSITGTVAAPGEILTADISASSDADGDPLTFVYQWYRADSNSGTGEILITGETNATYNITTLDYGKSITVKVTANDGTFDSNETTASYIYVPYSNSVFINELADPNNSTRGRFVELYNASDIDIDLSGWKLIRYTNGGTDPSAEEHHLAGTINANSTFVIGKVSDSSTSTADFISIYGFAPDQVADPHSDGTVNKVVTPIDSNGDDQILLIAPNGTTKDIFGVIGEDGSGTAHEFEDGKAVRKSTVTQSNPIWTSSEWDVWNDTGAAGTTNSPQEAPSDFTPGIR